MRKALFILLALLACLQAYAQTTRIKGRVTDASDGEGVPFAGVYFKGTTTGVSTDIDGYYTLETRDPGTEILCASILGYELQEKTVHLNSFNEVNFSLSPLKNEIMGAVIKPDNSYMKWILSQINARKPFNDPEQIDDYACDTYTKLELDLLNAEKLSVKAIRKNFGFVFDYMDTSVVSGKPYLPVMISETVSRYIHGNNPRVEKEEIQATKISGIDNNYSLSQFAGSMHVKPNLYREYLDVFNVVIPSPLAENGMLYYNYYLIDSLDIAGRKTYKIRFHPKKLVSATVLDGEINIDSKEFALQSAHVKMEKSANVNWIRDLVIDIENQRMNDSVWFYKDERMYADFSIQKKDSSGLISFIGNREVNYSNPVFGESGKEGQSKVVINKDVLKRDDEYWANIRPYELSEKEKGIYKMVEEVKNVPMYNNIYDILNMAFTGYYDFKYIGLGPISKLYSFNSTEGNRVQLGVRTTKSLSRTWRMTTYAAYGFKDAAWKGGMKMEYVFNTIPTRKFTASFRRDMLQLGMSEGSLSENSLFNSIFSKNGGNKRSPVNEYKLRYDHEFSPGFNAALELKTDRIFSNEFVPMVKPNGDVVNSIGRNQAELMLRFSREETVNRGDFTKEYIVTDFPVVTLDFSGALKGFGRNECSYFRPEFSVRYKKHMPPVGTSWFELKGGMIFGQVPYPLLKLHEGNGTYFLDKNAFACMDFYEFASDRWVTFSWEHDFRGFFLGKIPMLRRAQLRENFTLKAAYGGLTPKNDGSWGNGIVPEDSQAILLFPNGMGSLRKPYMEVGVGISNILRILRVDAFWRVTHRWHEVDGVREKVQNRFALNLGLEFKF